MDLRKFNTAHRRANRAETAMHSQCETMASLLQEFFDEEITVLWQESDGFVVLHGTDIGGNAGDNLNTHVDDVVAAVKKDKNAFR